jgi:hypothetical protein
MRKKLSNKDFSVRFMFIMSGLGITTVGQAKRLLDKCNPNVQLGTTRANYLQKELNAYLASNMYLDYLKAVAPDNSNSNVNKVLHIPDYHYGY